MAYTNSPPLASSARPLWHDPLFWGAVISLGAHGLMWIVVPLLPGSDRRTEADVQRPVELVELSPIDQNRLPDALTQPPTLPELAEPNFSEPPNFAPDSLDSEPSISFAPIFPTLPPPPPPIGTYRFPRSASPFPSRRLPLEDNRSEPSPTPTPTERPDLQSESTDDIPDLGSEDLGDEPITANPNATRGSNPATEDSEQVPQDAVPQFPPDLIARVEDNPGRFEFNEEGMDNQTANTNWGSWLEEFAYPWLLEEGQSDADLEEKADATRTPIPAENVSYPPIACVASAQLSGKAATALTAEDLVGGTAIVGVLVEPDGYVTEQEEVLPVLIRSTGYAFLDEEALEVARAQEFPPTSWREIKQVQVNFVPNLETCQQLLRGGAPSSEEEAS